MRRALGKIRCARSIHMHEPRAPVSLRHTLLDFYRHCFKQSLIVASKLKMRVAINQEAVNVILGRYCSDHFLNPIYSKGILSVVLLIDKRLSIRAPCSGPVCRVRGRGGVLLYFRVNGAESREHQPSS